MFFKVLSIPHGFSHTAPTVSTTQLHNQFHTSCHRRFHTFPLCNCPYLCYIGFHNTHCNLAKLIPCLHLLFILTLETFHIDRMMLRNKTNSKESLHFAFKRKENLIVIRQLIFLLFRLKKHTKKHTFSMKSCRFFNAIMHSSPPECRLSLMRHEAPVDIDVDNSTF